MIRCTASMCCQMHSSNKTILPSVLRATIARVRMSLVIGLTALFGLTSTIANAENSEVVPSSQLEIGDWTTFDQRKTLADNTVLFHYISEVSSTNASAESDSMGPLLRLSFVPRFNCTPIISLVFAQSDFEPNEHKGVLTAFRNLKFAVDGTVISFPTLTERAESNLMAHYDTELRRRQTFRLLLESGSVAELELEELGSSYSYSLSGSKRAISRALSRCRSHSN